MESFLPAEELNTEAKIAAIYTSIILIILVKAN